ncbi:hypothetical protein [Caballeronia ptereochthonis]|nr:hypothetical protein [Caballeronia ptereochthonis]
MGEHARGNKALSAGKLLATAGIPALIALAAEKPLPKAAEPA